MSIRSGLGWGLVVLSACLSGCEREHEVSFALEVQPILMEHCAECHAQSGEGVASSGFAVSSYESVMQGTKFGKVVDPGSAISSSLYLLVAQKTAPEIHMPPQHDTSLAEGRRPPLPAEKVEIIRMWIDQGAKNN